MDTLNNPQMFLREVNSRLVLPQPQPQNLFAYWALGQELRANLISVGAADVPRQIQALVAAGQGAPVPDHLDRFIRVADIWQNIVVTPTKEDGSPIFGMKQGETVKFRRRKYNVGGKTKAARIVVKGKDTATEAIQVGYEESKLDLHQYEGPYDTVNARPAPFVLYEFDTMFARPVAPLVGEVQAFLSNDHITWLDIIIRDDFRSTPYITFPDGITTVADFVVGGNQWFSMDLALKARETLRGPNREWFPFDNQLYPCVVPPSFSRQMTADPQYRQLAAAFTSNRNPIFDPISVVQDIAFFDYSLCRTYGPGETVPGGGVSGADGTVPTGVYLHEALLFGPHVEGHGYARMPQAHWADTTNYGKEGKIIWRSTQATDPLDVRGCQRIIFQSDSSVVVL